MKIALTHRSALEALSLLASRSDIGAFPRTSLPSGFRSSANTAEIECLQRAYGLQEPIQALSCETASRRGRGRLERRRFNPTCMTQGFVELEPGVFASSPELCFIQLCDELDVVDAVRLLGWMAGTYSLDCNGNLAHIERESLLCKESLANAFEQFKGVHGISSAKRAARYAPFRCASPKESEVGALLQLPRELGGCGFPAAVVNLEQTLTPKQQKLLHRRSFKCDFFWPGRRVAVEYDSKGFHSDADRIERDAVRRNALEWVRKNYSETRFAAKRPRTDLAPCPTPSSKIGVALGDQRRRSKWRLTTICLTGRALYRRYCNCHTAHMSIVLRDIAKSKGGD